MALPQEKIEKISLEVIKVLYSRFENFPEDASKNRNAPFHVRFLAAFADKLNGKVSDIPFFITLSSWLHGLNTTLGQNFFENVAHILSDGEKREYTSKKLGNLLLDKKQKDNIHKIISNLSITAEKPNLIEEDKLIFINEVTENDISDDFSADVFFEENSQIIAIELKTVRPNSGQMQSEKNKILQGKAALYKKFPGKNVKFYLGFPFDPTSATEIGADKTKFMSSIINMNKFFVPDEILLADELWSILSGEVGTMEFILSLINTISTLDFKEYYNFFNDRSNKENNLEVYKERLIKWNLFSELELVEKENIIIEKIQADKKLTRIFNQFVFNEGKYNYERYNILKNIIS
ncbi:MAG: TdeIII family type II restriction endonuclease [Bacteroidetes bacterium]|nr:TdeIII family type II restriction endonuclease [Bacteroidota bacterium]